MKLQQLRYLLEIKRQNLNISKAAEILCTSQSGVSKQIQLLEQELNLQLFKRKGKHLTGFSEVGVAIIERSEEIMSKVNDIRLLAEEFNRDNQSLTIATTHTQARYVLPAAVDKFIRSNPDINLHIHQGTPVQIANMLEQDEVDIAIATEALSERETLLAMPCYQWSRSIITQQNHPLLKKRVIKLEDIVEYPIITYVQGFTGRHKLDEAFAKHQLRPDIVLTAVDADVIKTYVRLGLGIGIVADMALNSSQDSDLQVVRARELFGMSTSQVAVKKKKYLKEYILRFVEMLAPHLSVETVKTALTCADNDQVKRFFADFAIPGYEEVVGRHIRSE